MKIKFFLLIALSVSVAVCFGAADMAAAADSDDGIWDRSQFYHRPDPLMDYVPQVLGMYDTRYDKLEADDCRACHGNRDAVAKRHQYSSLAFNACPDGSPRTEPSCFDICHSDPEHPENQTYNCMAPGCHSWPYDLRYNGWHHLSDLTDSYHCTACHRPDILAEGGSETVPAVYPTNEIPTPFDCENCHWQSGDTPGPPEWPTPIMHNRTNHQLMDSLIASTYRCYNCHGLDPYTTNWDHYDPFLIRYCQKCHTKDTLHAVHSEDVWGWEAAGFHVQGSDPNGVPDTYRLFTAQEACVGCHHQTPDTSPPAPPEAPPAITGLTPNYGAVGTSCTIAGGNFGASGSVLLTPKMGQTGQTQTISSASCSSWTDTSIVFALPAGLDPGNYYVKVETANGVSNLRVFVLTGTAVSLPCPTQSPQISSVNPDWGVPNVGVLVTIEGQDFGDRHAFPRNAQLSRAGQEVWIDAPIRTWTDTSITFWLAPYTYWFEVNDLRVVTEVGNSNTLAFTVADYPSVDNVDPASGSCDTWITFNANSSDIEFPTQQSTMLNGNHGIHYVVDLVGSDGTGTHTVINYRNWSATSLEVNFGDVFEDQIDPATGERNYIQDDGSGACADEPTISDCNSMAADMYPYGVSMKAIYFEDDDTSNNLSCGDTIIQVEMSDPFYFHLGENGPIINALQPKQQEATVPYPFMASWLSARLGYTVTNPRWGRVGIYGDYFGPERFSGDEVRIGDPLGPDVLNYNTDSDYYTVEDVDDGIGLKIGLWRNDLVGVYLFPAEGEIVAALYGPGNPGLGTMWLDKWLGLWVVKGNAGAPVASNVKPIKVRAPLPD